MGKKGHKKKKRQQPRPKKKKVGGQAVCKTKGRNTLKVQKSLVEQFKRFGEAFRHLLEHKDELNAAIQEGITKVELYFRKYDTIQLLGGIGLYLIDNLPTLEKSFYAQYNGTQMKLDEDAEVIAEYALNFGLSMPNDGNEPPTENVISDLREILRHLFHIYGLLEMPLEDNSEKFIDWMIHSETIAVRGDGYAEHVQVVFKELFYPHSNFFESTYGFTAEELFDFLVVVEDRVVCKLGSQEMVTGPYKLGERWKKWEDLMHPDDEDVEETLNRDFSKGMFGEFFEANPDVRGSEDGNQFLLFSPDDFTNSNRIFWVLPQNDAERNILEALSLEFGSNANFIADGEYKGNIMNGHSIYEKPFIKDKGRYYCFTPMLPHRNMFLIAEKLMMRDAFYYENNFRNNSSSISRDNYVEGKVKRVLQSFLPEVEFHASVHYDIIEDGVPKKPELDILGISEKATYIVEVKAHELSHKDRVGIKGTKEKFASSVAEACRQSHRVSKYIQESETPSFSGNGEVIVVEKTKPIYKIAVNFQHYSALLGQMDMLVDSGMLKEEYRDTWIVSLFDLMVCSEFFRSEDEFIAYLDMHKTIYANHSTFHDELDLLGRFLNDNFACQVKPDVPMLILDGHQYIDEKYSFVLPIESGHRN